MRLDRETENLMRFPLFARSGDEYDSALEALRMRIQELGSARVRDFATFLATTASPKGTVQREKLQSFATEFLAASEESKQ